MTREQELLELNAFLEVNFGPQGAPSRVTIEKYTRDHLMQPAVLALSCLPSDDLMQLAQHRMANFEGLPRYASLLNIIQAAAAVKLRIERLEATEQ